MLEIHVIVGLPVTGAPLALGLKESTLCIVSQHSTILSALFLLTLFVQEIGAWPESHKLRFKQFPMARTRGPP